MPSGTKKNRKAAAIGIECVGSTHSFSVAAAEDGEVLTALRFNMRINYNEQRERRVACQIFSLVAGTLERARTGDSTHAFFRRGGRLCAGITGVTTEYERKHLPKIWRLIAFPERRCTGTGDAEVLLPGRTGSLKGAVIIWHPGSVAYARKPLGEGVRVGGWGPVMGDEGSGYYIGRKALHALTWHRDKLADECPELVAAVRRVLDQSPADWGEMWQDLKSQAHLDTSDDKDEWIECLVPYCRDIVSADLFRYAISDLVPAVVEAAREEAANGRPDGVACRIIKKTLDHICRRFDKAVEKAGLDGDSFPVVIVGGIPLHHPDLRVELQKRISLRHPGATFCPVADADSDRYHTGAGAVLHALSGDLNTLPSPEICRRVLEGTSKMLSKQDSRVVWNEARSGKGAVSP